MITPYVIATIASRPGNGAPAAVTIGIAAARMSESPPRSPAQPTTVMNFQPGSGFRVMQVTANRPEEPTHREADHDTSSPDDEEPRARLHDGEDAGDRGCDCHSIRDDRRSIVHHALPFENGDEASRYRQPSHERG